ncbi:hypothetical protein S245_014054 [Arachis hypogaea]
MASLSMPSVSEQNRDDNNNKNNSISNKFLLPRKPARQPNPIIYRRLRRGSVVARISGKQTEYPTNKELLRTIAYLRNATAVFYEPDRMLPYNKAYIHDEDDDDEEGVTEDDEKHNFVPNDEKRKQELDKSMQKPNKNSGYNLTRKQTKKECDVSSSSTSHVVVNLKDTSQISDRGQGLTKKVQQTDSTRKTFMQFCSAEIICPPEHRAALAVKLLGVQAALLSCLGSPFENLSQFASTRNNSKIPLSLFQASTRFLPATIWTGMFIVSFAYTVMVAWSLGFRVPIISMLCLSLLYSLSVLVAAASGFSVICGTFRIHGTLFTCLGVLGFVMVLVGLVMLILFYSWLYKKVEVAE